MDLYDELIQSSCGYTWVEFSSSIIILICNLQWAIVPIMGRKLTQSQVDAGGRMERSGGAPKMRILTPNTVSGTCTEAATVQESLWNLNLPLNPCRL